MNEQLTIGNVKSLCFAINYPPLSISR